MTVKCLKVNMNKIYVVLFIFCLQDLVTSTNPVLYAVDVGDGNGLILMKKLSPLCPYYKSVKAADNLVLRFFSGIWELIQRASYTYTVSHVSQNVCRLSNITGTQLFTHEGEDMRSGTWFNVQKNTTATSLSVYALEDCTIYEGAILDAGKFTEVRMMSEDPSQCPNDAELSGQTWSEQAWMERDHVNVNIFTTSTLSTVLFRSGLSRRYNLCRFGAVNNLLNPVLKLDQTDVNARVIVRGWSCGSLNAARAAKTVNINEALVYSNSTNDGNTWLLWVYVGSVVGVLMVIIVSFMIFFVIKSKETNRNVNKDTESIQNSSHIILRNGKDLGSKIESLARRRDKIENDFNRVEEQDTRTSRSFTTVNATSDSIEQHNRSDVGNIYKYTYKYLT